MKKHEISLAFLALAVIILLVAALAGCDNHHAHHSPYPPTLNATGHCHWQTTNVTHKHTILVKGHKKTVTTHVKQSKLVCH